MAELAANNRAGTHTIRYSFDRQSAKILDLTDIRIAKMWGYERGEISATTRNLATRANEAGYNTIRYPSERGAGANLAIFRDFDTMLTPQMIVPSPNFNPILLNEHIQFYPMPGSI